MKKFLLLSAFLTAALLMTMACQKNSTANQTISGSENKTADQANAARLPADDAPRISVADAKKEFDAGGAIFVDSRANAAYKTDRIKGSINLTMSDLEARYKELPTDKKIIVYCS